MGNTLFKRRKNRQQNRDDAVENETIPAPAAVAPPLPIDEMTHINDVFWALRNMDEAQLHANSYHQ